MPGIEQLTPDNLWVYVSFQPERDLRIEFPKTEQAKAYFDQISIKKNGASLTKQYVDVILPASVRELESNGHDGIVLSFESHKTASEWKDAIFWSVSGRPNAVFVKLFWPPGALEEELGIASSDNQDHGHSQDEPSQASAGSGRRKEAYAALPPPPGFPHPPPSAGSSVARRRTVTLGPSYVLEADRDEPPDEQNESGRNGVLHTRFDNEENHDKPPGRRRSILRRRDRDGEDRRSRVSNYSPPGPAEPSRHARDWSPRRRYARSSSTGSYNSPPPAAQGSSFRRRTPQEKREQGKRWYNILAR